MTPWIRDLRTGYSRREVAATGEVIAVVHEFKGRWLVDLRINNAILMDAKITEEAAKRYCDEALHRQNYLVREAPKGCEKEGAT